jgi:hypothetical protein
MSIKNLSCARKACQSKEEVVMFNTSTEEWYCLKCAIEINKWSMRDHNVILCHRKEESEMKIAYSAVVLDESSQIFLRHLFKEMFPELKNWTVCCHHMTIRLGELTKELKPKIGEVVELPVRFIGRTDKAVAVRVHDIQRLSSSTYPHVTLAVNPDGGKPVMSNYITTWSLLLDSGDLAVKGTIQEVPVNEKSTKVST